MRGLIMPTLAAVLAAGTLGTTSSAQTRGLPPGDYQQTCRDIRSNNYRLDASCQRNDGSWNNTWLDYRSCGGSIVNDNGNLRCAGGASQGLPPGDYQRTCRDIRSDNYRLDASCQRNDGSWNNTWLDYRSCGGSIVNDDGNLRCAGGVPSGTYQQTCRDIRTDGNRLEATCQQKDGGWRNTSLTNYSDCRGQIENDDGNLRCR